MLMQETTAIDRTRHCLATLLFVLAAAWPGIAAAQKSDGQKPAGGKQQSVTTEQFFAEIGRYRVEEVELYRQHTEDVEPLKSACAAFLKRYHVESRDEMTEADWKWLLDEGTRLTEAGSEDPLILVKAGTALFYAERFDEAKTSYLKAWNIFPKTDYPARCKVWITERLRSVSFFTDGEAGIRTWASQYSDVATAWMLEEDTQGDRVRVVWHELRAFMWSGLSDLIRAENKQLVEAISEEAMKQQIDPWLTHMIKGTYHYQAMREYRYFAGQADEQEDRPAKAAKHLDVAGKHFRIAHTMRPNFPEAATAMIAVTMEGGGRDSPRDWFRRAVASQFDHMQAYTAFRKTLTPGWGGSRDEMLRFGIRCASSKRYETDVPVVLLLQVQSVQARDGDARVWRQAGIYERSREVLLGVLAEPTRATDKRNSYNHRWAKNRLLAIALHARRHSDALAALEQLGHEVDAEFFDEQKLELVGQRSRLHALLGPARAVVERIEAHLVAPPPDESRETSTDDAKDAAGAIKQLVSELAAVRKQDKNPKSQPYLDALRDQLKAKLARDDRAGQFAKGEWVLLTFDEHFSDWDKLGGQWRFVDGQTAIGKSTSTGLLLRQKTDFAGPKIIECDAEVVNWKPELQSVRAAILVGDYEPAAPVRSRMVAYLAELKGGVAGIAMQFALPTYEKYRSEDKTRIRVKVADGYYELYADDKFVQAGYHDRTKTGPNLVIGGPVGLYQFGEVKFRNVRVRSWASPAPPAEDLKGRLAYYEKRAAAEPNNAAVWYSLGKIHLEKEDPAEAIVALEKAINLPHVPTLRIRWPLCQACLKVADYGRAATHLPWAVRESHTDEIQKVVKAEEAIDRLALLLAAAPVDHLRKGQFAVGLAKKACEMTDYKNARYLQTLAAACAEVGDFDQALKFAGDAALLADETLQKELELQEQLYAGRRPYRLPTAEQLEHAEKLED